MKRDLCIAPKLFMPDEVFANAKALECIFKDCRVEVAILFGSLAVPTCEGGDLDLAVQLRGDTFENQQALHEKVCLLFRADNIDILPLSRAPFMLRKRALLSGRVLYEETPGRIPPMIEEVLFTQADFRYAAAMAEQELRARLRGGLSVSERRLDADRVKAYLSQLDVSVRKLTQLRRGVESLEDFTANEDRRDLMIHHLRIALECVLDICRHFLAVKGVSLQELETTNLIELAGTRELLPAAFANRVRGMAGMRNAIVYAYVHLDHRAIHEMIVRRLSDFDEFGRRVLSYLEREEQRVERGGDPVCR